MTQFNEDQRGGLTPAKRACEDFLARIEAGQVEHARLAAAAPKCPVCAEPLFQPEKPCPACWQKEQDKLREAQQDRERIKKERQKDIYRLGGPKAYNDFTLAKYDNKAAIELCAGYPEQNLYLWGAAGTGKTHLATALMREYSDGYVYKPQEIYRDCRGLKDGDEEQAAINEFRDMPYLIIDDLGQDKLTEWAFSTLYEIIEGRDMWERKGLIITSNFSLQDLAARMGRDCVISRINGLCKVVEITGPDRRMR
jgi:DNA replication protein DnaC